MSALSEPQLDDPWAGRSVVGAVATDSYRLHARLGRGGNGSVYAASRDSDGAGVAVKLVEPSGARRFLQELRALAEMRHPNIATLLDHGDAGGVHFLVMELVPGFSLRALLQRLGRLPVAEAAGVVGGVATALAHAHERGVLHRDIKPDNIMILPSGAPKLVDFGIARFMEAERTALTATGTVVGTAGYVAPELLDDKPFSIQSDLYALGVVLFEALAGRPPFPQRSLLALLAAHGNDPVPAFAAVGVADVPPVVERLVQALLAKTPGARPASASAVVNALAPFASAEATRRMARPTTTSDTTERSMVAVSSGDDVVNTGDVVGSVSSGAAGADVTYDDADATMRAPASAPSQTLRQTAPPLARVAMFASLGVALGVIGLVAGAWVLEVPPFAPRIDRRASPAALADRAEERAARAAALAAAAAAAAAGPAAAPALMEDHDEHEDVADDVPAISSSSAKSTRAQPSTKRAKRAPTTTATTAATTAATSPAASSAPAEPKHTPLILE